MQDHGRPKLIKFPHPTVDKATTMREVAEAQKYQLWRWIQRQLADTHNVYRLQVDHLYSPSLGVAFVGITTPRDKVTEVSLTSPRVQDRLWGAVLYHEAHME